MSDKPTEVVRRLYDLFSDGLIDDTFTLMHPDVTLDEPGDPDRLPWAGRFEGHEGLRRFYAGLAEGLAEITIDPESLRLDRVGLDQVLALGTERGVSASTGNSYVTESAWLWTVRGGRVTAMKAFHDTAAMIEACSLQGPNP